MAYLVFRRAYSPFQKALSHSRFVIPLSTFILALKATIDFKSGKNRDGGFHHLFSMVDNNLQIPS